MLQHHMKIAICGINYYPEPTGIAPYTTGIARGLARRGHDVVVLTGQPHYPYWKREKRGTQMRSSEIVDGVYVRRFKHPVPQHLSWPARAAMEIAFGLQLLTTRWSKPDVVICVTPPLLASAMAATRARLTPNRPAIGVLVQDMYSRGIVETRAATGISARAVRSIESSTIRLSDGVSVIHEGFAQDLESGYGHVRAIRNWTHVTTPDPTASAEFRNRHGWGRDEIIVLHAGAMGYKQGLENVVNAAQLVDSGGHKIRFVLLGDGNQRAELQALARGLPAIEFLNPVAEEEFPAALGAADVLLVNERPGIARMSVPSKLTSYFNSGRPVLAATDPDGLTAAELTASGAGICVPADRPDLLLAQARQLGMDSKTAKRLGEAGRRYCSEVLSEEAALDRYEQWIVDLANSRRVSRRNR